MMIAEPLEILPRHTHEVSGTVARSPQKCSLDGVLHVAVPINEGLCDRDDVVFGRNTHRRRHGSMDPKCLVHDHVKVRQV